MRLAPDLAYDTPNPGAAGAGTYDDVSVFNGAIDRFDWKLVGKKEMYVPYSSYRLTYHKTAADITKPNHLNPDLVRWELHRVWVVEATLKPDKRHIYSKRVFYLDEDSWTALASDQYDARGQLYRSTSPSRRTATTCRRRSATRSRSTTSARACTTSPVCSVRTAASSTWPSFRVTTSGRPRRLPARVCAEAGGCRHPNESPGAARDTAPRRGFELEIRES